MKGAFFGCGIVNTNRHALARAAVALVTRKTFTGVTSSSVDAGGIRTTRGSTNRAFVDIFAFETIARISCHASAIVRAEGILASCFGMTSGKEQQIPIYCDGLYNSLDTVHVRFTVSDVK